MCVTILRQRVSHYLTIGFEHLSNLVTESAHELLPGFQTSGEF